MQITKLNTLGIVALALLLSSCASKPLYYWGNYQDVIYERLAKGNNDGPLKHIELLQKDITYSQEQGLELPPGFHAHLGMLYSEVGNLRLSQEHLAQERSNFPESATLMDLFLKGQNKGKQSSKKPKASKKSKGKKS
ncbi:DUF4810 domain-containing protein [bacterium]|nr:DUF4810 domain-containing protein [bacterium]